MISLSDNQLQTVMTAAGPLALEKRACFLERIAAQFGCVRRPSDGDVEAAVRAALKGLVHVPAA